MCDFCEADSECKAPTCASQGGACLCALSGPERCPACGHACAPWYWGMGLLNAPNIVSDFLGGEGTESGGFDGYPVTRAQLLAKFQEHLAEQDADDPDSGITPADRTWLSDRLPEGAYQNPGDVFSALLPVIDGSLLDGKEWSHPLRLGDVAAGTRLIVPPSVVAVLVSRQGQSLDAFPSGQFLLSEDSAPRTTAVSRRPAKGATRWTLRADPVFFSKLDQNIKIEHSGRSKSGSSISLFADIRFALADPAKLVQSPAGPTLGRSQKPEQAIGPIVVPLLKGVVDGADASSISAQIPTLEGSIRSTLEAAGLAVRSVKVSNFIPSMGGAGMFAMNPEMMARMPPEARAMMEARMNEAMQRRAMAQTPGVPGPVPPGTTAPTRMPPSRPPGARVCPACHASNPDTVKFCQTCGKPMAAPPKCPSCGKEAAPGIKFCGNCGTRLP